MKFLLVLAVTLVSAGVASAGGDVRLKRGPAYVVSYETLSVCKVRRCGPNGCRILNVCKCPDRYSCKGLYDAYGPYGGTAYLKSFSPYY